MTGEVEAVGVRPSEALAREASGSGRSTPERADAVRALADRVSEVEDALAEILEGLDKLRRQLARLDGKVATKKQVKKLKKVLDQLEVIEVGPEVAPPTKSVESEV